MESAAKRLESEGGKALQEFEDAILSHPAGVMTVVAVAGSVGILYGMVTMLFVQTFQV